MSIVEPIFQSLWVQLDRPFPLHKVLFTVIIFVEIWTNESESKLWPCIQMLEVSGVNLVSTRDHSTEITADKWVVCQWAAIGLYEANLRRPGPRQWGIHPGSLTIHIYSIRKSIASSRCLKTGCWRLFMGCTRFKTVIYTVWRIWTRNSGIRFGRTSHTSRLN
jgi:hypothetical protein